MEEKSEVSEHTFTEGKALLIIYAMCTIKFMIKIFEKWREVMVLNLSNLVLKRYWKSMKNNFKKCVGTLLYGTVSVRQLCYPLSWYA